MFGGSCSDGPPDFGRNTHRFSPYFDDALGAIDGTQVPVKVPAAKRAPFRNRKGVVVPFVLRAGSSNTADD
jgi:hypothetical protein